MSEAGDVTEKIKPSVTRVVIINLHQEAMFLRSIMCYFAYQQSSPELEGLICWHLSLPGQTLLHFSSGGTSESKMGAPWICKSWGHREKQKER